MGIVVVLESNRFLMLMIVSVKIFTYEDIRQYDTAFHEAIKLTTSKVAPRMGSSKTNVKVV